MVDIKKKLILDSLEAAPGHSAPDFQVTTQNNLLKGSYDTRIVIKISENIKNNA